MQVTVEIPENKVSFVMELFKELPYLKIKSEGNSLADFRQEWAAISAKLPQTEPDMNEVEIMQEIRTVRRERNRRQGSVAE